MGEKRNRTNRRLSLLHKLPCMRRRHQARRNIKHVCFETRKELIYQSDFVIRVRKWNVTHGAHINIFDENRTKSFFLHVYTCCLLWVLRPFSIHSYCKAHVLCARNDDYLHSIVFNPIYVENVSHQGDAPSSFFDHGSNHYGRSWSRCSWRRRWKPWWEQY